jgi:hypothetical protein
MQRAQIPFGEFFNFYSIPMTSHIILPSKIIRLVALGESIYIGTERE